MDVPVGASVVVTATGTVAANATGFLVNTATAVPPAGLVARSTPTATDTDQLLPQADLSRDQDRSGLGGAGQFDRLHDHDHERRTRRTRPA